MTSTETGMPGAGDPVAGGSGATIGLKSRVLSMPEVLAQSVANMAPSAAMALVPLLVLGSAGNGLWLSFAIAIVLMIVVAYCAAQFAKRVNSAGSFYLWITRSLGPGVGHAAGWGLVLGYVFTGVACVLGFEIYGATFLSGVGLTWDPHVVHSILYVLGGLGPALVAVRDIRISTTAALLLEAVSVAIIITLCIAVYVHQGSVFDSAQLHLHGFKFGGMVVGVVLAIFAFVGFESAGALGQEARAPVRSVPRSILLSCGVVGLFYLVVAYTQLYGFGADAFGNSSAPLPDLAGRVGLSELGHFIAIGITASMFACVLACLNAASRMMLSFAHDGFAPKALAHTSKNTGAPDVATWLCAAPMVIVPVAYIAAGSTDTVLTGEAGTLATYGFMLAYALVCVAAPRFLAQRGEPVLRTAALGTVGALAMLFVFYVNWIPQLIPNDIFTALTWPSWALPYVFIAWTAVGAAWYWAVRLRLPNVVAAAGHWHGADAPSAGPMQLGNTPFEPAGG